MGYQGFGNRQAPGVKAAVRKTTNVDTTSYGMDDEMRETLNTEAGRKTAEHYAFGGFGAGPAPKSNNGGRSIFGGFFGAMKRGMASQKARTDELDNAIAKAQGQRNYYENSPSKTKGRVAIKMGNR